MLKTGSVCQERAEAEVKKMKMIVYLIYMRQGDKAVN